MDYKEIVDFINNNNEMISHITTWQTWNKINPLVFEILLKLRHKKYISNNLSNTELWNLKRFIHINLNDFTGALRQNNTYKINELIKEYENKYKEL